MLIAGFDRAYVKHASPRLKLIGDKLYIIWIGGVRKEVNGMLWKHVFEPHVALSLPSDESFLDHDFAPVCHFTQTDCRGIFQKEGDDVRVFRNKVRLNGYLTDVQPFRNKNEVLPPHEQQMLEFNSELFGLQFMFFSTQLYRGRGSVESTKTQCHPFTYTNFYQQVQLPVLRYSTLPEAMFTKSAVCDAFLQICFCSCNCCDSLQSPYSNSHTLLGMSSCSST